MICFILRFTVSFMTFSEQCKQRAKFSIAGEDEGDEDSLNFSAKRSTAQTSAMDDDDDLESFNPLEEGELKFSKNLEPENEEERREVEGSKQCL